MSKILLINPSYRDSYGTAKAAVVDPIHPVLGLMTIAAVAERGGHKVEILDLSYDQYDYATVKRKVLEYRPDIVGITATTPLMNQMRDISVLLKSISKNILVVGGGPHVTALPRESLLESELDAVVVGEGDVTFGEIADARPLAQIKGIQFRKGDDIVATLPRPFVENLDDLPMPAWHLYDSRAYKNKISRLLAKRSPLTMVEFSRGCVFQCNFCASKNTMAWGYRKKSPERCAEEIRLIKHFGYREFALADDIFTSDGKWATAVSEALIKADTGLIWTCTNGIRVESAEPKLFQTMKAAGCYRVSFGFETGNEQILTAFGKGGRATLAKGREAVRLARQSRIDVSGFFMLGLSPDNEATMRDTIRYAKQLPLDMLKFGIAIAFPGTQMFREYREAGLVKSYNWDEYFVYTTKRLFAHRHLTHERVLEYMKHAYREAILGNWRFIFRRLVRGLKTGELIWDFFYFCKFFFSPSTSAPSTTAKYFAKDRWPKYDFANKKITIYPHRSAQNRITDEHLSGLSI